MNRLLVHIVLLIFFSSGSFAIASEIKSNIEIIMAHKLGSPEGKNPCMF